jgi:hypothetical protein
MVKPEATTAVIELLMMGGETPETCWTASKRQDNKLENYCIWLVIYLKWMIWYVFNLLKTKRNLLYIRHQSVPRCKHFPPRF